MPQRKKRTKYESFKERVLKFSRAETKAFLTANQALKRRLSIMNTPTGKEAQAILSTRSTGAFRLKPMKMTPFPSPKPKRRKKK